MRRLFEDLQQGVEDVGVGFFDLVEQHDRERLATHLLGELTALVVADIAGGEPTSRLTVCFSRYSDTSSSSEVSSRTGTQRGSWPARSYRHRRTQEDERARWSLRVLQASAVADRLGNRLDGVLLADDPLVQFVFHPQELVSSSVSLYTGIPVHRDRTSAMASSSTSSNRSRPEPLLRTPWSHERAAPLRRGGGRPLRTADLRPLLFAERHRRSPPRVPCTPAGFPCA